MDIKKLGLLTCVFLPSLILTPRCAQSEERPSNSSRISVYKQNFNSLSAGPTQPFPGAARQDGWYRQLAIDPAYGEIESNIALGRKALHEFTSSTLGGPVQTIDMRLITPPDLSRYPRITLQANFYAHTSDLNAANTYSAGLAVRGGPHPGFEILGFRVNSGNGPTKEAAGVNVGLARFNGADNNEPVALTVGQNLAWNAWHVVKLVVDQETDRYVSIEVDGKVQDISLNVLPRSKTAPNVWERGQLMQNILAEIVPNSGYGGSSEDDIYWDNLKIMVERRRKGKSH
jgi:hypothetical protein